MMGGVGGQPLARAFGEKMPCWHSLAKYSAAPPNQNQAVGLGDALNSTSNYPIWHEMGCVLYTWYKLHSTGLRPIMGQRLLSNWF